MKSNANIAANVTLEVHSAESGRLLRRSLIKNLVVADGLNKMCELIAGTLNVEPTHIALGDDDTEVTSGDTALGNELHRDQITRTNVIGAQVILQLFVPNDEGNGNTYSEAGLINQHPNNGDTLWARFTFADIEKTAAITITITWEINLSAT